MARNDGEVGPAKHRLARGVLGVMHGKATRPQQMSQPFLWLPLPDIGTARQWTRLLQVAHLLSAASPRRGIVVAVALAARACAVAV